MQEGFGSVADLKLIAETNDSEFRAGLARMREGVRDFQEQSTANLSMFDKGVDKSKGGTVDFAITALGALGPYGKAAAAGLKLVKDNWGLVEDTIRASGAGDELDDLEGAFAELAESTVATAKSLLNDFSPGARDAKQDATALGDGLKYVADMFRDAKSGIEEWRPASEQSISTLAAKLTQFQAQLKSIEADARAAQSNGAVIAPWVQDEIERLKLEIDLTSQTLDIKRRELARASESEARAALPDIVAQIDLLKAQREMLGKPGDFEWYKIELRAQAELEKAGITDKEAIARALAKLKAEYLDTTGAIADYNKQKQTEASVSRTFDAMERETQTLRNRAAAMSLAAGEAAKLQAIESGLLQIRQARGGEATDADVRRINDLAEARAREAQAADDARLRRDRDNSFERQARSIEASTAALTLSTAEQARASYVEQELQRIRQANREATADEIATINANADAVRDLTQARVDMAENMQTLLQSGQVVGRGLEDVFRRWSEGAEMTKETMHDMAVSILADLAQIAFQKSVIDPLINGLFGGGSSGSGGGLLASLFGGARAGGGDVNPGQFYLVGEKGPELFMPAGSGSIVPNDKLGGAGTANVTINQTIDARGAYPESIAEIKRAIAETNASVPQLAVAAIREATDRGGM